MYSNYRGITLLSLSGKVYASVLERRVRQLVNLSLRRNAVAEHWTSSLPFRGYSRAADVVQINKNKRAADTEKIADNPNIEP